MAMTKTGVRASGKFVARTPGRLSSGNPWRRPTKRGASPPILIEAPPDDLPDPVLTTQGPAYPVTHPSSTALSLTRRDAHAATDQFSEAFFRRLAELAMSALEVPVVAIRMAPDTLWVATPGVSQDVSLSTDLQESTLFRRLGQAGNASIEDVWAEEQFAALVDLEDFDYRFFAGRQLTNEANRPVGQLCVLDNAPRTLAPHHHDVLQTLAQMAQSELARQQEAARRRRGEALQDRLQRVLQMIARDEPIDLTLEALMYLVEGQLPGLAATLHWLDPTEHVLRPVAAPSVPEALIDATDGLPADAEAGSIGAAVHDGEEVLDDDAPASIDWADMRAAIQEAGFTSSWSVPVRSAASRPVLGVITVFSADPLTPTSEIRQTVDVTTHMAAVALERDRDRSMLERVRREHHQFMQQCSEGMYRLDLRPPVRIDQRLEAQIQQVFGRTHIAECNDAFAQLHGFDRAEDLIGQPLLDIYGAGQDLAQLPVLRAIDHDYMLDGAQSCEIDQQGRERWFTNTLEGVIENGRLVSFWGGQREVTHEQHAAYALRESDHRYETLTDLSPNLVMVHTEHAIETINAAGAEVLGATTADQIRGRSPTDFMREATCDDLVRRAPQPDAAGDPTFHTYELHPLRGAPIRVELTSCHILWHGQPAVLTVARERTQQLLSGDGVATGDVTLASQSMTAVDDHQALKSAFRAGMDPAIRTPLTAMIGFAEILDDEIDNPSELGVHDLVDRIRANGQQLLWALDAISNQARLDAHAVELRPQAFDLVHDVEDVVETLDVVAREKGGHLELHADPPSINASLDRTAFERVVGHVIVHAIRSSGAEPVIIRVHEGDDGPVVTVSGAYQTPSPFFDVVQGSAPSAPDVDPSARVVHHLLDRMGARLTVQTTAAGSICAMHFQTPQDARASSERHRTPRHVPVMSP